MYYIIRKYINVTQMCNTQLNYFIYFHGIYKIYYYKMKCKDKDVSFFKKYEYCPTE